MGVFQFIADAFKLGRAMKPCYPELTPQQARDALRRIAQKRGETLAGLSRLIGCGDRYLETHIARGLARLASVYQHQQAALRKHRFYQPARPVFSRKRKRAPFVPLSSGTVEKIPEG